MGVLERHQHWLACRQADELRQERGQRSFHASPGRQLERRIALAAVNPKELGEERDLLLRIGRIRLEQRCDLVETRLGTIFAANTGGVLKLADERKKGAVLVQCRPEIAQPQVRLLGNVLLEGPCEARLSDPGLAADQHDTTFAALRLLPAAQQQLYFLGTPDGPRGRRTARQEADRAIVPA